VQTYPIKVIQAAFHLLVDSDRYVKFTYYRESGKPSKIKAKLVRIVAVPEGLVILTGVPIYINRMYIPLKCIFYTKNIRWIDTPFDMERFENLCASFAKKLAPGKRSHAIAAGKCGNLEII